MGFHGNFIEHVCDFKDDFENFRNLENMKNYNVTNLTPEEDMRKLQRIVDDKIMTILGTERTDEIIVIAENNGLQRHACLLSREAPLSQLIEISSTQFIFNLYLN